MKTFIRHYYARIEWLLGGFVVIAALTAWLQSYNPAKAQTLYDLFPPLGLMAFGLMWTHFVLGALKRFAGVTTTHNDRYMLASMGLVLALILLHPGLLWLALYLDGLGLPPMSYIFVYQSQLWAVLLGSMSLTIFLAFELKRWFGKKNWWKYIEFAQIIAMIAIFFHALELGGELKLEWFRTLWWLYGISLLAAIIYVWKRNRTTSSP